ncbi:MAG: hypothetical protein PVH18_00050 [Chloroflexota bacterium]|jgi:hypothetical protein
MKLTTTFHGNDLLFEGDLSLMLKALPSGARVTAATATLAPSQSVIGGTEKYVETLQLANGLGEHGIAAQASAGSAIVDLGARRTLRTILARQLSSAAQDAYVHVDMGGTWLQLDNNGGIALPDTDAPDLDWTFAGGATSEPLLALPDLTGQRFKVRYLTAANGDALGETGEIVSVTLLSYPSNLSLRVGLLGPFWFRNGDLRSPVTTPDFAAVLQAHLDLNEPQDEMVEIPFILHSDTLTRLALTLDITYHFQQRLLPEGMDQVTYPFAYDAASSDEPLQMKVALPSGAKVLAEGTSVQLDSRFETNRIIHGPVESATKAPDTIVVEPAASAAHPIKLDEAQKASAIDLHLEALDPMAELLITLQEDVGGKPFGDPLLAEPIRMTVVRPAAGGSLWASALLPAEFTFQAGQTYWLIVNSADGKVAWGVEAAPEAAGNATPLQVTVDGGLSWRAAVAAKIEGPVKGLYRLRAEPDEYYQPMRAEVGGRQILFREYDAARERPLAIDSWEDMAETTNAALEEAAEENTVVTERVNNGDFADWTRVERPGQKRVELIRSTEDQAFGQLAIAPDSTRLYATSTGIADFAPEIPGWLQLVTNEEIPEIAGRWEPEPGQVDEPLPISVAVSPTGDTVYMVQSEAGDENFPVVEIIAFSEAGTPRVLARISTDNIPMALTGTRVQSLHLAVAPDCSYVYLAGLRGFDLAEPVLIRVPVGAEELEVMEEHVLTLPLPDAIDNSATSDQSIWWHPADLLISPDGQFAYVPTYAGIFVVELEAETWSDSVSGWVWIEAAVTTAADEAGNMVTDLTAMSALFALAMSPDGQRLYALKVRLEDLTQTQNNESLADQASRAVPTQLLALDAKTVGQVATGAAGAFEAAIRAELALELLFELTPLQRALLSRDPSMWWQSAVVAPDNTRLMFGSFLADRVVVVDIGSWSRLASIDLPFKQYALAITPDSRRLFVTGFNAAVTEMESDDTGDDDTGGVEIGGVAGGLLLTNAVFVGPAVQLDLSFQLAKVELDGWTADEWALTGGRIAPVALNGDVQKAARLGSPHQLSGVSQVFPVRSGVEYELSFRARADKPGAEAELFWLNEECGSLDTVTVEIKQPACGQGLQRHAVRTTAPPGATHAELRFRQPAGDYILFDDVSFRAPDNLAANGDFSTNSSASANGQAPAGWEIGSANGTSGGSTEAQASGGIYLKATAGQPATLSQAVSVRPGEPYVLTVEAYPYGPAATAGQPTVSLIWTGNQVAPLTRELTQSQFDTLIVRGQAPAGVTGAEIRFEQPAGGTLAIDSVVLEQPLLVEVPVTFLSETPGELTIIEPVVAYDVVDSQVNEPATVADSNSSQPVDEPTPTDSGQPGAEQQGDLAGSQPEQPEIPCKPTPPHRQPRSADAAEPDELDMLEKPPPPYCPCCETFHYLEVPDVKLTKSGMPKLHGNCPICQTKVVMYPVRRRTVRYAS